MILKNEWKIRKMLDYRKYHLCVDSHGNWKLYGNKDTSFYFSELNEPIMTSETHTEKDLLKFAKEHHQYNEPNAISAFRISLAWLAVIFCILNFKCRSDLLREIIFGIDLVIIVESLFQHIISKRNFKISMKEYKERWGKLDVIECKPKKKPSN